MTKENEAYDNGMSIVVLKCLTCLWYNNQATEKRTLAENKTCKKNSFVYNSECNIDRNMNNVGIFGVIAQLVRVLR